MHRQVIPSTLRTWKTDPIDQFCPSWQILSVDHDPEPRFILRFSARPARGSKGYVCAVAVGDMGSRFGVFGTLDLEI